MKLTDEDGVDGPFNKAMARAEKKDAPLIYFDPSRVRAIIETYLSDNPYRSGYGKKIPTSILMKLDDKRWHRVYVMCWSNSGSPYVLIKGEVHMLGGFDPRYLLKGAAVYSVS